MRISRIELTNWLRYRGSHGLDLEASAYGVAARWIGDETRSNWAGKSALLAAVRFALFGDHPRPTEDDWISVGEGEGSVAIVLSDGLRAERSRVRGESTRLIVRDGDRRAARDEAQELIERRIGLSRRDFLATSFFEQKRMHRFVTARPAERFADVAAWVRLGTLRRAEEGTREKLAPLAEREIRISERARMFRTSLGDDPISTLDRLRAESVSAALAAERAAERAADEKRIFAELVERRRLEARAAEHERVESELAALSRASPRVDPDSALKRTEETAAGERLRSARETAARLRVLARGEFDGACPVAPIGCPARSTINSRLEESRSELVVAEVAERNAAAALSLARSETASAERAIRELQNRLDRESWLRQRAAETADDAARFRALGDPPLLALGVDLEITRLDASRQATLASEDLRRAERAAIDLRAAEAELESIRREARTLREAAAILGRAGAQRRIAEEAVRAIEAGANARLAAAGIGLSVSLTWGRETGELAPACDSCGAAFPPGRSAKVCRCGAERGPKVIDELGCELSSTSGAAEDLAGVALSLSAAEWIRGDRLSGWGTALVDEPFGSLDEVNRRAMARLLAAELGPAGGFEQALVVAHHESAMEALAGRIRITAGPRGSWARVSSHR